MRLEKFLREEKCPPDAFLPPQKGQNEAKTTFWSTFHSLCGRNREYGGMFSSNKIFLKYPRVSKVSAIEKESIGELNNKYCNIVGTI